MNTPVLFTASVQTATLRGPTVRIASREFLLHPGETGRVKGWLRRTFNRALKEAGPDVIVSGSFDGQMKERPYTMWRGGLSGVNGKVLREEGSMGE